MGTSVDVVRGTTNTFRISIRQKSNTPYVMSEGEILRFGVKEDIKKTKYVLKKEVDYTAYDEGDYLITLLPEDTLSLEYKKYWYDIGLQSDNNYYIIIECSPFNLIPNITSIEGADDNGE